MFNVGSALHTYKKSHVIVLMKSNTCLCYQCKENEVRPRPSFDSVLKLVESAAGAKETYVLKTVCVLIFLPVTAGMTSPICGKLQFRFLITLFVYCNRVGVISMTGKSKTLFKNRITDADIKVLCIALNTLKVDVVRLSFRPDSC